ncbi:MAG TPA: DNA mismatch repair endonuclease MutL [Gemmatimonadaceae bacterium]|nr:DNA mismatch repair endonuclease MutL [Gemmatimonadaceae bacterium]
MPGATDTVPATRLPAATTPASAPTPGSNRPARRIAVLPSAVADQIAAGEVVERPASAVKELVENALDAGATTIDIHVEEGGRSLIRVADDGSGMTREDAVLAIERHATSKIREAADLVGVRSFGFRGEALPAIASVSRLEITTAIADGEGTQIRVVGGSVEGVSEAARRTGTTVSVGQLFFNTPARQKFLRGARSEWRAITEAVIAMALARRDVRFQLAHDGTVAIALPPAASLRSRVAALWGADFAERFLEVDDVQGPVRVSGLVERPADVGTASRRVWLMVNGRAVRDNGLVRAVEAAYRSTIAPGLRPSLLLDVQLPADAVDVNVHPAKAEVRFRERWPLERVVERAVRRALGVPDAAAFLGVSGARTTHGMSFGDATPVDVEVLRPADTPAGPLFSDAATEGSTLPDESAPDAPVTVIPDLIQLRRTWLLFERDDGVVLIDQHSAHERILFERFVHALERGDLPAQRLLLPETLHLGPAEADAFESNREALSALGFDVELFGGHSLIVNSVPLPHPRFDALRCLRDTLSALTGDRVPSTAARHERLAATVACKAAIKAGDVLSGSEMRALYRDLAATTLPAHDVHGRSTIVRLSWDELERRFGRR